MKIKIYIPEIFLGALLAVAIFLMGFVFGASKVSAPINDQTTKQATQKSGQENPQLDSSWWATDVPANWLIAFVTILLFIVACLQIRQTRILQRAYISVEGLGIEPLGADIESVAHLSVRNRGKLPARNVSWSISYELCTNGSKTDFPICNKFYGGKLVIPSGAEMRRSQNYKLTQAEFDLFTKIPRKSFFYIWGEIQYTDSLGTKRITKFCHRYDSRGLYTVPADRPHGGARAISGESMRMHQYGNDAD